MPSPHTPVLLAFFCTRSSVPSMDTEALLANVQMPCRAYTEPVMQAHSLFPQIKKQEGMN